MKRSSGPRKTANLSESVHQRLNMYAMSATAAGVGLLALMQAAQAKIVYTPADKPLPLNHLFYLDLNHDGRNDFKFLLHSTRPHRSSFFLSLKVEGLRQGNKILSAGTSFNLPCAAALPKGMTVGPKSPFQKGYLDMFWASGSSFGGGLSGCPWIRTQAYLGMRFSINGQVHYGWARFVTNTIGPIATLTGYAYETIPGKPIIAGATKGRDDAEPTASLNPPTPVPATLGALAMGAPGLSIWRREESVGAIS